MLTSKILSNLNKTALYFKLHELEKVRAAVQVTWQGCWETLLFPSFSARCDHQTIRSWLPPVSLLSQPLLFWCRHANDTAELNPCFSLHRINTLYFRMFASKDLTSTRNVMDSELQSRYYDLWLLHRGNLCVQILVDIFLYLPYYDLLRVAAVCKIWYLIWTLSPVLRVRSFRDASMEYTGDVHKGIAESNYFAITLTNFHYRKVFHASREGVLSTAL